MKSIGVVGYGSLGEYLVNYILKADDLKLSFVWNRTTQKMKGKIKDEYILTDLKDVCSRQVDLIVEVSHPDISKKYGELFLKTADYMVGSPTAFADPDVESLLRSSASEHGCYIPSGALWGGEDIMKMADRGTLQALKVTMKKHTSCWKFHGELKMQNENVKDSAVTLFEGPVRTLCPLAPNNVNTMAAASIAAHNLGFDKVMGSIVSDPQLTDWHIVQVDAWGQGNIENGTAFHAQTIRKNPATIGAVTGSATYGSFVSSMLKARDSGPGIHLC